MFEKILPSEIEEKIYRLKHNYDFKKVMDDIKNKNYIEKNEYYIIKKENMDRQFGIVVKRQYAKVDGYYRHPHNNKIIYSYYYGHFGFHEGYAERDQIRKLNEEELVHHNNNHFWQLPQQFYQSTPG